MINAIKIVAIWAAIMITGAMGIWLSGCAGHDAVTRTAAEMIDEEIGIAVAGNNMDGDFADQVDGYYLQMQELAESGSRQAVIQGLKIGIEYLLSAYTGDNLTSRRIASKVIRLLELSGLDGDLEVPADNELLQLDPDYIMDVVAAFVGGVRMV